MKTSSRTKTALGFALILSAAELAPLKLGLIGDAAAVIGRPATPVSYAGVARRTAYRGAAVTTAAVATTSAAAASASTQAASAPPPQAAPAPAPAAAAGDKPAVGTVVPQLPGGCVAAPVKGVEYQLCNGVYYRTAFQGNNLVYVVQVP